MELNQPGPTKSISINRSKLLIPLVGICLEGDCSDYILSYQHIVIYIHINILCNQNLHTLIKVLK